MHRYAVYNHLGAITGLLAAICLFSANIINDLQVSPLTGASTIARVLIAQQRAIFLGSYLVILGSFCLIGFVAYLHHVLLTRLASEEWLTSMVLGGGLVGAAMLLLNAHFSQAFTILTDYGTETQVAKALYLLDWNWYLLVEAPAFAAMIGALSILGYRHKLFARWLVMWGGLISLLLLAPFVTGGGMMLVYLWLMALSISLLRQLRAAGNAERSNLE